jgi:hypothetical protein
MVVNMGNYNTVRAEVTSESDDYYEAFSEARGRLYDAAYHLAKEVSFGLNKSNSALDFLSSKLTEEPRL